MRLWSIHPKYLDQKGLCGCWAEACLAQDILLGKQHYFSNHPELNRFKECEDPVRAIGTYMLSLAYEGCHERGYNFDFHKIKQFDINNQLFLTVTKETLINETCLLIYKFRSKRKVFPSYHSQLIAERFIYFKHCEPHPLFTIEGE